MHKQNLPQHLSCVTDLMGRLFGACEQATKGRCLLLKSPDWILAHLTLKVTENCEGEKGCREPSLSEPCNRSEIWREIMVLGGAWHCTAVCWRRTGRGAVQREEGAVRGGLVVSWAGRDNS